MKRILCVGGITADVSVRAVDRLPPPGQLEAVQDISVTVGGCAANAAIDLGRLGVPTSLCYKIGTDSFGILVERASLSGSVYAQH